MKKKLEFTIIEQPSRLDFFAPDILSTNEMVELNGGFDEFETDLDWCVHIDFNCIIDRCNGRCDTLNICNTLAACPNNLCPAFLPCPTYIIQN